MISSPQNFIFIFLFWGLGISATAQVVNLPCQSQSNGFIGLDRKDWNGGNTAFHSEGILHNFDLPNNTFGSCKKISSIEVNITINNVDISGLPPGCPPPGSYYININQNCPDLTPASCNVANLVYENPNNPLSSQVLNFTSPPENFSFGENFGVDIVPVMDVNCPNGQSAISTSGIVLDYEICVIVTIANETISSQPDLGSTQTICPTSNTLLDPGTFESYLWDPNGETSPSISVGPGNYTVTVTDINGCSATDDVLIAPFPDPTITILPANPVVCDGGTITVGVNEIYPIINWSTGISGQSVNLPSGTHMVTVTDNNGCIASSTTIVNSVPPPNAGDDGFIQVCNNGSFYDIQALLSIHDPGGIWGDDDFSGIDINTNPSATAFVGVTPGTYQFSYTVTGTAPCADDQAIIMVDVFDIPDPGTSNFFSFCNPGNLDLINLLGNPSLSGTWADINGAGVNFGDPFAVDFSSVPPGTYELSYTLTSNGPCSSASASLFITIENDISAGQNNSAIVCENIQYDLSALLDPNASSGGIYEDTDISGALAGSIVNTTGLAGQTLNFTYSVGSIGDPCGVDNAILTLNVQANLSSGVGSSGSYCQGDTIDLYNLLTNEDPGGTFDDVNSTGGLIDNLVYSQNIPSGNYDFSYTVGDGAFCPQETSNITVTILESPNLNFIQEAITICENDCQDFEIELTGSSSFNMPLQVFDAYGDLKFQTEISTLEDTLRITLCSIDSPIYYSNDSLSITTDSTWIIKIPSIEGDVCRQDLPPTFDSLIIDAPTPSFTNIDSNACGSDTILINNIKFYEGFESFVDTLQGSICDSIISINVTFNDADTFYLRPTLCPGDSVLIGGTWYGESNSNAEINTPLPNGCDSITVITLMFYPPSENLIADNLCSGDSITVNGLVYNENNPSGRDTLYGQSMEGCDSIIIIDLQFTPGIVIDINDTLCEGDSIIVNNIIYNSDNPTGTEVINGVNCDTTVIINLTFFSIIPSIINGIYCSDYSIDVNGTIYDIDNPLGTEIIVGGDINGCDSIVLIDLGFWPSTVTTIDTTICEGDFILVNGTIYDKSNLTGREVFESATLQGCDSLVNVNLTINNIDTSYATTSICEGDSVFLAGNWQFIAGDYTDTISSTSLCNSLLITTVVVDDCGVDVQFFTTDNTCGGDSMGIITIEINSALTFPITLTWTNLENNNINSETFPSLLPFYTITNLLSGDYELQLIDGNGTVLRNQPFLIEDQFEVITSSLMIIDSIKCETDLGSIEVSPSGGSSIYSYAWSDDDQRTSKTATNLPPGTYSITITDSNGCKASDQITLDNIRPIEVALSTFDPSCEDVSNGRIEIESIEGGTAPYSILVNTVEAGLSTELLSVGTYEISISDANGCEENRSVDLQADIVNLVEYQKSYTIVSGQSVDIIGEKMVEGPLIYMWSDSDNILSCQDCPNPIASPTSNATLTLTVISEDGCEELVSVTIIVEEDQMLNRIPNAFSPNGDGENDEFFFSIDSENIANLTLRVFDRWGNKIHDQDTGSNQVSWNGRFTGNELSDGVYIYQIVINYISGDSRMIMGDVLLIH